MAKNNAQLSISDALAQDVVESLVKSIEVSAAALPNVSEIDNTLQKIENRYKDVFKDKIEEFVEHINQEISNSFWSATSKSSKNKDNVSFIDVISNTLFGDLYKDVDKTEKAFADQIQKFIQDTLTTGDFSAILEEGGKQFKQQMHSFAKAAGYQETDMSGLVEDVLELYQFDKITDSIKSAQSRLSVIKGLVETYNKEYAAVYGELFDEHSQVDLLYDSTQRDNFANFFSSQTFEGIGKLRDAVQELRDLRKDALDMEGNPLFQGIDWKIQDVQQTTVTLEQLKEMVGKWFMENPVMINFSYDPQNIETIKNNITQALTGDKININFSTGENQSKEVVLPKSVVKDAHVDVETLYIDSVDKFNITAVISGIEKEITNSEIEPDEMDFKPYKVDVSGIVKEINRDLSATTFELQQPIISIKEDPQIRGYRNVESALNDIFKEKSKFNEIQIGRVVLNPDINISPLVRDIETKIYSEDPIELYKFTVTESIELDENFYRNLKAKVNSQGIELYRFGAAEPNEMDIPDYVWDNINTAINQRGIEITKVKFNGESLPQDSVPITVGEVAPSPNGVNVSALKTAIETALTEDPIIVSNVVGDEKNINVGDLVWAIENAVNGENSTPIELRNFYATQEDEVYNEIKNDIESNINSQIYTIEHFSVNKTNELVEEIQKIVNGVSTGELKQKIEDVFKPRSLKIQTAKIAGFDIAKGAITNVSVQLHDMLKNTAITLYKFRIGKHVDVSAITSQIQERINETFQSLNLADKKTNDISASAKNVNLKAENLNITEIENVDISGVMQKIGEKISQEKVPVEKLNLEIGEVNSASVDNFKGVIENLKALLNDYTTAVTDATKKFTITAPELNTKGEVTGDIVGITNTLNSYFESIKNYDNKDDLKKIKDFEKEIDELEKIYDRVHALTIKSGDVKLPKIIADVPDTSVVDSLKAFAKAVKDTQSALETFNEYRKKNGNGNAPITVPIIDTNGLKNVVNDVGTLADYAERLNKAAVNLKGSIDIINSVNPEIRKFASRTGGKKTGNDEIDEAQKKAEEEKKALEDFYKSVEKQQEKYHQLANRYTLSDETSDVVKHYATNAINTLDTQIQELKDKGLALENAKDSFEKIEVDYQDYLKKVEKLTHYPSSTDYEGVLRLEQKAKEDEKKGLNVDYYKTALDNFKQALSEIDPLTDTIEETTRKYSTAWDELNKAVQKSNSKDIEKLVDTYFKHTQTLFKKLKSATDNNGKPIEVGSTELEKAFEEYKQSIESIKKNSIDTVQAGYDLDDADRKIRYVFERVEKIRNTLNTGEKAIEKARENVQKGIYGKDTKDDIEAKIKELETVLDAIRNDINNKSGNVPSVQELEEKISALTQVFTDSKNDNTGVKNATRLEQLSSRIGQTLADNTKIAGNLRTQFQNLQTQIETLRTTAPATADVRALEQEYERLKSLMYETGQSGKSTLSKIMAMISGVSRRVFAGDTTYRLLMKIRQIPSIVREIDTAMTDLKRVTAATSDEYDRFLTTATQKAKELGSTVKDTVSATASFGRLGYNLSEASTLAESALIYKNVGWVDINTATDDIVSVMKAFNIEANKSLEIVDSLDVLGNKFALTSADVGTGLRNSASALATANNSFEQTAAMITAITEITQDAANAGTALRTLSLRIRSTKAELTEMGEEAEGAATTTAKLRKQLLALTGVDILDINGDFKSTYEIMQGIAKVWNDLSDQSQAAVLESLAGKTRANQVAALLNNWSQAEKALDETLNSSGAALKENDKYLKSAEGRLAQLKATGQDFATNVFNSDELKAFIKGATKLLDIFTKLDGLTSIGVLTGIGTAGAAIKNPENSVWNMFKGAVGKASFKAQYSTNGMVDFSKLSSLFANVQGAVGSEEYIKGVNAATNSLVGFNNAQKEQIANAWLAYQANGQQTLSLEQLGMKTASATAETIAFTAAQAAASAIIGAGIGFAISSIVKIITEKAQEEEKATEAALNAVDVYNEEADSIENYKTKIIELRNELENSNLSHEEAYEKRKELLTVQDEIIDKYGEEAKGISIVNGELEKQVGLLDIITRENARETIARNQEAIQEAEKRVSYRSNTTVPSFNPLNNPEANKILKKYDLVWDDESENYKLKQVTARESIDTLTKIVTELSSNPLTKDDKNVKTLINSINDTINSINSESFQKAEKLLKDYAPLIIQADSGLSAIYSQIENANAAFQKAIEENDADAANNALETLERLRDMYTYTIQQENSEVQKIFTEAFDKTLGDKKNITKFQLIENTELQDSLKKSFGEMNVSELKDEYLQYFATIQSGSQETVDSYKKLETSAEKYGVEVEDLIDILGELGIIQKDFTNTTAQTRPFSQMLEDIEDAQKALDKFDSAIEKSNNGGAGRYLTRDELNELLSIDETLVDSVEQTANGYIIAADKLQEARDKYYETQRESVEANIEETKKNIQMAEKARSVAEKKIAEKQDEYSVPGGGSPEKQREFAQSIEPYQKQYDGATEALEKYEAELKAYEFILNELKNPSAKYTELLKETVSTIQSLTNTLGNMQEEMKNFGHISAESALDFMTAYENWDDFIEITDNGFILKETSDDFEELIKKTTGYDKTQEKLNKRVEEATQKYNEAVDKLSQVGINSNSASAATIQYRQELEDSEVEMASAQTALEAFTKAFEEYFKVVKASSDLSDFNKSISDMKHQLDMNSISSTEYLEQYIEKYEDFKSKHVRGESAEVDNILDSGELEIYNLRTQQATKQADKAFKELDRLYTEGNISLEEKVRRKRQLAEQYYGLGTILGDTEDGKDKYLDILNELEDDVTEITQKSYDDRKKLIERNREDNLISIDEQINALKKLNEEYYNPQTGKLGKTRSAIDSKTYEENLREIENLSKQAYDYWVSEAERARKMGIINEEQLWQRKLDLAEQYLRPIAQLQDEYRDAQDEAVTTGQQALYDEELRELENNRTLKIKNEKVYWGERYALAKKYYKDNAAFEKEWIQEETAYRTEGMRAMYEEDIKNSENAYKRGEISLSAHIHNMTVAWEQYYKGKKELREEDLQAQQTIQDEYKNGIQSQISAIEAVKSAETERLNGEIELLEESKAEYQRVAQEKEKAIDKEIRALQRQKDAIDKKTQAEKDSYEMAKAMINLYKASMNTRLVYTGGGWELRRDEQKYQDALKEVNEKKDEAQAKQLDKAIEALQEQKTAISDATSDVVDEIEKDITERQLEIKKIEAPFNQLTKILTSLIAKMTMENLDPQFISMILNSEGGQEAVDRYMALYDWITDQNKEYSKAGNKSLDEFYSYYKDRKPNNFISSNAYTQATRAALEIANDANTNSATKELIENFKIDLRDSNMTNKELREWIERLAASNNMTFDEMAQKFGLADYFTDPAGSFKDALDIANNVVDKVTGQDDKTEETAEAQASDMETITTSTTGIMTNTSEILKLIQNFSAANPNLFVGAEGNKISTTADVKNNAGKIADTINNSPVFNINVTGNADKSIVSTMRKELTNAFNEYTDILTGALGVAHQRQLTT